MNNGKTSANGEFDLDNEGVEKVGKIAMWSTPSVLHQYRQGCLAKLKFTYPRFDVKLFLQVNIKSRHLFELLLSNYDLPIKFNNVKVLLGTTGKNSTVKIREFVFMLGIVLLINHHIQLGLRNSRTVSSVLYCYILDFSVN